MWRKIVSVLFVLIIVSGMPLLTNTQRIEALEKQQTIFKVQIKYDSIRINNLEKRVTALEDYNKTYSPIFIFDTVNYFRAIKQDNGNYLIQLKTKQ